MQTVRVIKAFKDADGKWKAEGHIYDVDPARAIKLRQYGAVQFYRPPEKAVAPPPERAEPPAGENAMAPGPEETAARKPRGRTRRIVTEE